LGYVGLAADADTRIGHCSSGMRQRLSLAAAQLAPCDLLVLDEPATSLDPQGSHLVEELVARTTDAGGAVIVASHDLRLIARVCTSFAFMRAGRLSDTIGLRDAISSAAAVESFADKSEASLERWLWLTSFGDESGV
jgi:ABC-2 type transport system ATP-binding protein